VFALAAGSGPAWAAATFDAQILALHNQERAAVGVPPLVWSDTLADDARSWAVHLAQTGDFEHSPPRTRSGEGENLWEGTAGAYDDHDMIYAWIDEKAFFHPGTFPDDVSAGAWQAVGHYTQMIWGKTDAVGCALATGKGYDVLVCRYSPPGNVLGRRPF
jgi:hypothetical protein